MRSIKRIVEDRLLIVEGTHEEFFFKKFLENLRITGVQVMPVGGKDLIRKNLPLVVKDAKFPSVVTLAIVRDADQDPNAALQSVKDVLTYNNLQAPDSVEEFVDSQPRTAIMILPSITSHGALETLCLSSIVEDPIYPCIETYFQCLNENERDLGYVTDKHRIQVYLASKNEDFLHTGLAAEKGYWLFSHSVFSHLREFLTELSS